MKYIYILFIFAFFYCRNENNSKTENKKDIVHKRQGSIAVISEEDGSVNVDIRNWQDSLPDSIYKKRVINLAVMENSNVKLRKGFINTLSYLTILESRLGSDTLFMDSSFKQLNYLSLINPRCAIVNLDTIPIRKLDYISRGGREFNFALDLTKIEKLDTIIIDAPDEYIDIPIDKSYKRIGICTRNNQLEELRKYYENVFIWFTCK